MKLYLLFAIAGVLSVAMRAQAFPHHRICGALHGPEARFGRAPLPGVTMRLRSGIALRTMGTDIRQSVLTDFNGGFVFTNLSEGDYEITAVINGVPLQFTHAVDPGECLREDDLFFVYTLTVDQVADGMIRLNQDRQLNWIFEGVCRLYDSCNPDEPPVYEDKCACSTRIQQPVPIRVDGHTEISARAMNNFGWRSLVEVLDSVH